MHESGASEAGRDGGPGREPVLVTGALGFVASRLIPRLLAQGTRTVALVRPGRDASRLESLGVEVRRADLGQRAAVEVFHGIGSVVHLAGLALVPAFLPALVEAGVTRGVFVSSAGVYTRLPSRGADAKRTAEALLAASPLDWTLLRPSMIYGRPGDRNLERLLRWLARVPLLPLPGAGKVLQQPVHVDDLVDAILAALVRAEASRRAYDVGGPEALPLRGIVAAGAAVVGRRAVVLPLPVRPIHALVRAAARLGLRLPVRPEQVLRLQESKAVDIGPARRDLGFAPRSFEEGIRAEASLLGLAP